MTQTSSNEVFRRAAEAEDGMCVSAGARVSYVRSAVHGGKALLVDLTSVPEPTRPLVIESIKEMVNKARAVVPQGTIPNEVDSTAG